MGNLLSYFDKDEYETTDSTESFSNGNFQSKILFTAVILISLFLIVLKKNSFNDKQFVGVVVLFTIFYMSSSFLPVNMETFTNYKGNYNNRRYVSKCDDKWRKTPCNLPLNDTMGLVPQGNSVPINIRDSPVSSEHQYYPSVDGSSNDKRSMFMFAYNKSSPDCCPSTYTTSNGCVCTNVQQRKYLNQRGLNNSPPNNF